MDDRGLRSIIIAELDFEPGVEAESIGVTVHDGVVTLTGHAPSYAAKVLAEETVRRVKGVRALVEQMEVRRGPEPFSDEALAERAANVLRWTSALPKDAVTVQVEHGAVTLTGEVEHAFQRRIAEQEVRALDGVVNLHNEIALKSRAPKGDIKASIEEALSRNCMRTDGVHLEARDGVVTLTGEVPTWFDQDMAERLAWSAPGVLAVENRLAIVPAQMGDPLDM